MAPDEIPHDHPTTHRKSHKTVLFVPLTVLTLVAILTGIFLSRSLAAPRLSSHSTAIPLATPALQCGIAIDYRSLPPITLAGLKHASDAVVLGVVTGSANSFNDWYVSIATVVYDRRQVLTNTQTLIVRQDHAMVDGCFNADDPLLTVGERTIFFLSGGISFSGTTPYYHEIFDANCRFPSVNGLIPRNTTSSLTFDRPPTEASFIAQVRAVHP